MFFSFPLPGTIPSISRLWNIYTVPGSSKIVCTAKNTQIAQKFIKDGGRNRIDLLEIYRCGTL